ncbi:piggyBac transposable element-derived protein 4 [Trichonephila clavipes]|nr:piggyBac transposable element-derived protein 4 [Trichonephila clavipes]
MFLLSSKNPSGRPFGQGNLEHTGIVCFSLTCRTNEACDNQSKPDPENKEGVSKTHIPTPRSFASYQLRHEEELHHAKKFGCCSFVKACSTNVSNLFTLLIALKCRGIVCDDTVSFTSLFVVPLKWIATLFSAVSGPHYTTLKDWLQAYGQSPYHRYETWCYVDPEIIPINDYVSDLESETDSKISINDSGSIDSFSDDFDFDISDDKNDDLSQARNFYEIDCNNPSAPPPRFAFINTPEIHLDFDASSGKMQYYEALIDNNLIDLIVHETNHYAEQTIIPRKHSRSKKWEPTSKEEMPVFTALIIFQGIVKNQQMNNIGAKDIPYRLPFSPKSCPIGVSI